MTKVTKKFWELSRSKQENFIENIYKFSKDTKDIFSVWIEDKNIGERKVLIRLIEEIKKQTSNKIGKSRKIKVSNLNQIIKNARKYPLSNMSIISIYFEIWTNFLDFLLYTKWIPERYQKSCSKFIEEYFLELENIPEVSEREDMQKNALKILDNSLNEQSEKYINIKNVYLEDIKIIRDKF
jgi:hypothetical protein